MTDQAPESFVPPEGAAPAPPNASAEASKNLYAYVETNAGTYTNEAITAALMQAGYAADDIRVALAATASREVAGPAAGKAVRRILALYIGTFVLLSAGMLLNSGQPVGYLMPTQSAGVGILAVSLVVAFVASLIWVASRRAFAILLLLGVVLGSVSGLSSGGASTVIFLAIVLASLGGVVLVLRGRKLGAGGGPETALGVLLAIPVLLLLVVGGICVVSGLPIPRVG